MCREKGKYLVSDVLREEEIFLSEVNFKWCAMGHLYKDANCQQEIVVYKKSSNICTAI